MNDLVKKVEEFYKNNVPVSRKPDEQYFGHVEAVRKYALELGKEYAADLLVLEMAALLHDVGADAGAVHAEKSAEISKKFLAKEGVDEKLTERILSAIIHHSMSKNGGKLEEVCLEDQILRDADAIGFFEFSVPYFLQEGIDEFKDVQKAKEFCLGKIAGMKEKIETEKGLELARQRYDSAKKIIINF